MKTWAKYLLILLTLVLGVSAFYFKVFIPKHTYETRKPKIGTLSENVFGIGNVDAKEIYTLSSQTGGKITNIFTDEGLWVKKDSLIATIDGVDLPLLLQEAKISLQKAKYTSIAAKKEIEALQAQKNLITISYKRYAKLYAQKFASKAEYDKADSDLQSINAQIAASKAHMDSSESEILRVQTNIDAIKEKLSRLSIYAPVDGFVIAKDAQISQNTLPAQSIIRLVDPKTVWVKTYIDERVSAKIELNQNAEITLRSHANKTFKGRVIHISAISDKVTQEREIGVAFETLPTPFYINEQAEVRITTDIFENIFTFDISLLRQENAKSGVWIEQNQKAHFLELHNLIRSDSLAGVKSQIDENTKILVPNEKKKTLSEGMEIFL